MQLLYFSWIRERIGTDEEEVPLPEGVNTVAGLTDWLAARGDGYAEAFADPDRIRVAVNLEHVGPDHPVADEDEVAYFPPVTGGAS